MLCKYCFELPLALQFFDFAELGWSSCYLPFIYLEHNNETRENKETIRKKLQNKTCMQIPTIDAKRLPK